MKTITRLPVPFRIVNGISVPTLAIFFLVLFATSCTDHEVPDLIPAKIKTLPLKHGTSSTFYVQFEDLGNIPITEYGIVMSTGIAGHLVSMPTVDDEVLIFTDEKNLDIRSYLYNTLFPDANYRAFAKLSNGTVVYGELLKFRFQPG